MAVRNFILWENWVSSKVVGTRTTFFVILDPKRAKIWP